MFIVCCSAILVATTMSYIFKTSLSSIPDYQSGLASASKIFTILQRRPTITSCGKEMEMVCSVFFFIDFP